MILAYKRIRHQSHWQDDWLLLGKPCNFMRYVCGYLIAPHSADQYRMMWICSHISALIFTHSDQKKKTHKQKKQQKPNKPILQELIKTLPLI